MGPVFKNPPANAGDAGTISGEEITSHVPHEATKYACLNKTSHVIQQRPKASK